MSSSQTSVGMGSGLDDDGGSNISESSNLTPQGGKPPGETLYDCIAYVIYCGEHERMALVRALRDNQVDAVWLPFIALSSITNWKCKAEEGVQMILKKEDPELETTLGPDIKIPVSPLIRLHIERNQIPVLQKFITRIIYFVKLSKSTQLKCCENTKRIQWYSLNEVISGKLLRLWGPEVKQFALLCKRPKCQGINEYPLKKAFCYLSESKGETKNIEEELLKILRIGRPELEFIYTDYLEHCFPSIEMTIHSFKDYLIKYGYNTDDRRFIMLFNAFDYNNKGYIEFTQLLIGMVFMDKSCPHTQQRVGFVFRYYDIDCDSYLNQRELRDLIRDINPDDDNQAIDQKTREWLQNLNADYKNRISFQEFSKAVGSLKFRGTSSLCRCDKPILTAITKSISNRELCQQKTISKLMPKDKTKDDGPCIRCRVQKYEFGIHGVSLDTDGRAVNIHYLRGTTEDVEISNPSRIYSVQFTFESQSLALVFIDMIREFNVNKNREKGLATDEETFLAKLNYLCKNLELIFSLEERVIKINGPVQVIGDIYGTLTDLMAIDATLWPSFPVISSNILFLGNYIDFGKWGVECALYVLCLKLISPNKVFLLRGKHEIRDIQTTFQRECIDKYGESVGKRIWQMFNNMFDRMPFAVVIDETIFCANSGIPETKTRIQDLKKLNKVLTNPSAEAPIVWQLLNNELSEQPIKKTGVKNGSSLFSEGTVNNFLEENGFTHIICGNRLTPNGYDIRLGTKFINVFSTSDFKESNNRSAVLLITKDKINIIRLDLPKEEMMTKSDPKSIAEPKKTANNL